MSQFPADPHFDSVVLFLPFEGTDGDTTFVDASINNYPMSSSGANLGTSQIRFSTQTTSAEITGALGNSITTTASPIDETMSWTIECWIYPVPPAYGGGSRPSPFHPIAYQYSGGGNSDQGIYVSETGALSFYRGSGHTNATVNYSWSGKYGSPRVGVQFNQWNHVAVCYDVGSPRLIYAFINGILCENFPRAVSDGGWFDSANPFRIGDWFHPSYSAFRSTANAYYSDYRISSFVRYTGNFRPPRGPHPTRGIATDNPITPGDPYYNNVVLRLPLDGNDGDTSTTDYSNSNHLITFVGTAQLDTATSVYGSASLLLDGDSDYITAPDSTDWEFLAGDFTIEFWYRFNNVIDDVFISYWENTDRSWYFGWVDSVNQWRFVYNSSSIGISYAHNPSLNQWYHIATCREGGTMRLFIDGVNVDTETGIGASSINTLTGTAPLRVGALFSLSNFYSDGQFDDVRITKGVARYTGTFRPPRGPYPTRARG